MAIIKLNDIDQYKAYFSAIAKSNKNILHIDDNDCHFYIVDIFQMLDDEFKNGFQNNSLILEYFEAKPSGANASQLRDEIRGAFYVIKEPVPSDDKTAVQTALKFSLDIGRQILSKMKKDADNGILSGFDIRQTNINKVGPIGDDFYFYRIEFDASIPANNEYCYNADNWN